MSIIKSKIANWLLPEQLKTLPFIQRHLSEKPQWNAWDTKNAIENGLKASVWVYRCINKRAKAVASIPWYVEERVGDTWQRVPNHPIEVLLTEPNPFMTGQKLMEYLVNHLDLSGNALWKIVKARGVPVEFWTIVPDTNVIRPVPHRNTFLSHYEYQIDPGNILRIEPNDIIHFKTVDPANYYWGLSPIQVAAKVIDTDIESVNWNKISLQNRAVTDGIFSFSHPLTKVQWEEARAQIREQHQGSGNSHTPWVLGSGATWHQMSLSPVEMDFLQSRKYNREEICAVFDVPPILVGSQDAASYNNYSTARRAFYEDSIVPLLDDIRECLDMALVPYWDTKARDPGEQNSIRLMYDLNNVTALQEEFGEKVKNAEILYNMGIPLEQINQRLELGFMDLELRELESEEQQ